VGQNGRVEEKRRAKRERRERGEEMGGDVVYGMKPGGSSAAEGLASRSRFVQPTSA